MIILDNIQKDKKTSHLVFKNENGKKVYIPVPTTVGDLIFSHLKLISTSPQERIDRGNEENSD